MSLCVSLCVCVCYVCYVCSCQEQHEGSTTIVVPRCGIIILVSFCETYLLGFTVDTCEDTESVRQYTRNSRGNNSNNSDSDSDSSKVEQFL